MLFHSGYKRHDNYVSIDKLLAIIFANFMTSARSNSTKSSIHAISFQALGFQKRSAFRKKCNWLNKNRLYGSNIIGNLRSCSVGRLCFLGWNFVVSLATAWSEYWNSRVYIGNLVTEICLSRFWLSFSLYESFREIELLNVSSPKIIVNASSFGREPGL